MVGAGQAVLATGPDRVLWMLNQGRRYRLLDNAAVRLAGARTSPLALPGPLLDLLPGGAADRGAGDREDGIGGARAARRALVTSDVVRVGAGGTGQSFVVLATGWPRFPS